MTPSLTTSGPRPAVKLTVDDMLLVRKLRMIELCLEKLFPGAVVTSLPRRLDPRRARHLIEISVDGVRYAVDVSTSFVRDCPSAVETLFSSADLAEAIVRSWPIPVGDAALQRLAS